MKSSAIAVTALVVTALGWGSPSGATAGHPAGPSAARLTKTYANCTALHRDHPHGVGRRGARDKTSGTPVTTFTRNTALYRANASSDRDKDGIACEQA